MPGRGRLARRQRELQQAGRGDHPDQPVAGNGELLAFALSRVKGLLTVNTPPMLQAIVAAQLLQHDCSLEPLVAHKRVHYRRQRDAMCGELLPPQPASMEQNC